MTRLVLDASAGVELLLNTPRAHSLAKRLPSSAEWWVPEHYFVEVAGALRRAALNGDVTDRRVQRSFAMLDRAVLRRTTVRPLLAEAWERRAALTIADAIYVVLAQRLGATLVTADERLARAPALGVETLVP